MASPCNNSPDEVIEKIVSAKANAEKFDQFVNGTDTQTVQLGSGSPTPSIRNVVRQVKADGEWIKQFIADAPEGDVSLNNVTALGSVTSRTLTERFSDIVNVRDFGAKGDGVADDKGAFDAAAEASDGGTVFVPAGHYKITGNTNSNFPALWVLNANAQINSAFIHGVNDTSALTGRVFDVQYRKPTGLSIRIGGTDPWLEYLRTASEALAELSVTSATGRIGILGATKTSLHPEQDMGSIGLCGIGINDNTTIADTCYAQYLEYRRQSGVTGITHGLEIDGVTGDTTKVITPVSTQGFSGLTVNLWLSHGGGTAGVSSSPASCAIGVVANPVGFDKGIIFRNGSISGANKEAICFPQNYKISWYDLSHTNDADEPSSYISHARSRRLYSGSNYSVQDDVVKIIPDDHVFSSSLPAYQKLVQYGTENNNKTIARTLVYPQSETFAGSYYILTRKNNSDEFYGVTLGGTLAGAFLPTTNGDISLGVANHRWSEVFAATGTINTSDERLKQAIEPIPEKVLDAWGEVEWLQFKMKDRVKEKGENARIHTGIIAQRINKVFSDRGLDARKYGLLCYDEWEASAEKRDSDGTLLEPASEKGNQWSVRYEEALAMEVAYLRRRTSLLEAKIAFIEGKLDNERAE